MAISLSAEQSDFIAKALEGNNILVDACIGSGKTTSIQYLCEEMPSNKSILYLTYNHLLKLDAKSKIHGKNTLVTNYHGFASFILRSAGITCGISDLIRIFNKSKLPLQRFDCLIIDEYQDIDTELSEMLAIIKSSNPSMQIIAVGDMQQKINDKTKLDVRKFIDQFLGEHICMTYTQCFRLNKEYAEKLGRIWNKTIVGTNDSCEIIIMHPAEAVSFISKQNASDILCLGSRYGALYDVLNDLELLFPKKFNKQTVYASIRNNDNMTLADPDNNSAIFTTYDSSKGLERKICVIFDFTKAHWDYRVSMPHQKYEILRNIFCLAASRGKQKIIFVKEEEEELLSEETLSTPVNNSTKTKTANISEMFDFKRTEDVEACYNLLHIQQVERKDYEELRIKRNDGLIDLSPCIGIFQEAVYFTKYRIDKEIEWQLTLNNNPIFLRAYTDDVKSSLQKKILYLTALETKQLRYISQVNIPFVSPEDEQVLNNRLATLFSRDENSQVFCHLFCNAYSEYPFFALGIADVVKDNTVYELKFVSELMHKHFLQCACYVVALKLKKGILWNTRNNEMYEISIPNEQAFLSAVAKTVQIIDDYVPKEQSNNVTLMPYKSDCSNTEYKKEYNKNNTYAAVIDIETTWKNEIMSIGVSVFDEKDYSIAANKYYILSTDTGRYSFALNLESSSKNRLWTKSEVIDDIRVLFSKYSVSRVLGYNANFDCRCLPELDFISWYDIMKISAYRQFNPKLSGELTFCSSGRLKNGYSVERIYRLLSGSPHYFESHNALRDTIDQIRIMEMIGVPIQTYYDNALIRSASCDNSFIDLPVNDAGILNASSNSSADEIDDDMTINAFGVQEDKTDAVITNDERSMQKTENNYLIDFTWSSKQIQAETEAKESETNQPDNKTEAIYKGPFQTNSDPLDTNDTIFATEAAAILHVSKSTVYKLIRSGCIHAVKYKNKYHISRESVYKYLEERRRYLLGFVFISITVIIVWIVILLWSV